MTATACQEITDFQLRSLGETDSYETTWRAVLQEAEDKGLKRVKWGGRGKGGRGRSRRTYQPQDVVVDNISLVFSNTVVGKSKTILEDACLKLLSPRPSDNSKDDVQSQPKIYSLVGANGCGKSTLLKRIYNGSIPGFPPHISTLYLPQEVLANEGVTVQSYLEEQIRHHFIEHSKAIQCSIGPLEESIEKLDLSIPEHVEEMEQLTAQIGLLEEDLHNHEATNDSNDIHSRIVDALEYMGIPQNLTKNMNIPLSSLSPGLRKKVILSSVLLCPCDLLLLDEPSAHLDIIGLIQLRRLLLEETVHGDAKTTVLLVSHDLDLVNQVATNIIELRDKRLFYYNGNYSQFIRQRRQEALTQLRHDVVVHKKKDAIMGTIQHLKEQNPSKRRGGAKKKQRQIDSQRKKLERLDQKEAIDPASITQNANGTQIKRTQELLQQMEKGATTLSQGKNVQFTFRDPKSQFGEPLVLAYEIGYAMHSTYAVYDDFENKDADQTNFITRKEGFLFDSVDVCIEEAGCYCILGENGCGKSALMRVLAKTDQPTEGKVTHAANLDVALIHQELADNMLETGIRDGAVDALTFLSLLYPAKTEQERRGELANFGIDSIQSTTNLRFLSGGERVRVSYAAVMMRNPNVLFLDNPTNNLDAESVEALADGLSRWKGTVVFISHDTHFIRSLDPTCFVLIGEEGKLRRVVGGVDTYLRSFAKHTP